MTQPRPHAENEDRRRAELIAADRRSLWHPFTQDREWRSYEPIVVERADGYHLIDVDGRRYVDGVSAIWCNVHGHGHPKIVAAMKAQIDRVCHSTMLGLTHEPGVALAERLVALAPEGLTRVFYSDAGSTAVEVALRMTFQYWRQSGSPERKRFISLTGGYHGDTMGSVSLGFSEPFHSGYEPITFEVLKADPPFLCAPISGRGACDAASMETASVEALGKLEALLEEHGAEVAAVFIEPMCQGAAGIWPQPESYVRGVRELCDRFGPLLVCDEVATGFGRTGTMFAVEQPAIRPDVLCLGKGITAGYLPLAATLATEEVFEAFSAPFPEYRTLFHGHTYGGNPLGCATALANLDVFEEERTVAVAADRGLTLGRLLDEHVAPLKHVGPIRRLGTMVGFDLWKDASSGTPFPTAERRAHQAVLHARDQGVIVRPLGDTMVLMPPLNMPEALLEQVVVATARAVEQATR